MRLQHAPQTRHPAPAAELLAWAQAVTALKPSDPAAFEDAKARIAAALRRLAGSFRATR